MTLITVPGATAEGFDDSEIRHIAYPDWFVDDPFLALDAVVAGARDSGKQGMMVLFTTEGCSYCDAFIRKSLADPVIGAQVRQHFAGVGLEIFNDAEMTAPDGDAMRVKTFAKRYGVEFSPTILFFAGNGRPVLRLVGYQSPERFRMVLGYVTGEYYRSQSLRDYLQRHVSEASQPRSGARLIEDPLFSQPPYNLDRTHFAGEKPLLLIFEQPGCAECVNFHRDVLAKESVRAPLEQFEVVRLDAVGDTPVIRPDGTRGSSSEWFEQFGFTRLPALVFFSPEGEPVLQTDALVLKQRMLNSLEYVLEGAYDKGWTYQRFARQKGMERYRLQSQ